MSLGTSRYLQKAWGFVWKLLVKPVTFLVLVKYLNMTATKTPASKIIHENNTVNLSFNVMPDRPVEEVMHIKQYEVADKHIKAVFDREYYSAMLKSPDHLIFLTALIHTQKLLYCLLCHELGYDYDPDAPEVMKLWPYSIDVNLPKLIRKTKNLTQDIWIKQLERKNDKNLDVGIHVEIEKSMTFDAAFLIKLI